MYFSDVHVYFVLHNFVDNFFSLLFLLLESLMAKYWARGLKKNKNWAEPKHSLLTSKFEIVKKPSNDYSLQPLNYLCKVKYIQICVQVLPDLRAQILLGRRTKLEFHIKIWNDIL